MTRKFAAILAMVMLCAMTATEVSARSRHYKPRRDNSLTVLLRQNAELLRQVREFRHELAEIRSRLKPEIAAVETPPPAPPPRNPVLAPPIKIPDATAPLPAEGQRIVRRSLGNIRGLKERFIVKLAALRAAMPAGLGFKVGSGFRSRAEQAALHRRKPRLAARPGHSNHERGLAADLEFKPKREGGRWVRKNAHKFGLRFPMGYEPWHIEPIGVTRYASRARRVH